VKLTNFFLPIQRNKPQEAQILSHQLMLQTGMINAEAAGLYSWLPLGLRVLKKVENFIRVGMNSINCHELLMPTVQPADLWRKTGRYDAYGPETLRFFDRHNRELLYGPTNEDMVTEIFGRAIKSYKQLPCRLFQIQWKFRDEIRPRFGVMRGREFLMKDGYSFDLTPQEAEETYWLFLKTYVKIFATMGLKVIPVKAPTGPIGGDLSHEFHIIAGTGESTLYYDPHYDSLDLSQDDAVEELLNLYAAEEEIHDPSKQAIELNQARGIEVGHIFYFADKYTKILDTAVTTQEGRPAYPLGSSYGIGVGRVVAASIEANHDEHGIKWPLSLAPFDVGLISLGMKNAEVLRESENLYQKLRNMGAEVLYDDTDESPGNKFNRMDLIGLPYQMIIGPKSLAKGEVEIKERETGHRQELSFEAALNFLSHKLTQEVARQQYG